MTDWPTFTENGAPLTRKDISVFEDDVGASLPDDYISFLLATNGGVPPMSRRVFDIHTNGRDNTTVLNSFHSLNDQNESCDLKAWWELSRRWLPVEQLPIGSDCVGGGISLCISESRHGSVWYLDGVNPRPHDANPRVSWYERRDVCMLAPSFEAFIGMLRADE